MLAVREPICTAQPLPAPGRYRLDPERCIAEFSVRHMLLAAARGRVLARGGELWVDADDPFDSWVRVDFDAASVMTHNRGRDDAVRSPDLLDVERYPVIRYESFDVTSIGEGTVSVLGDFYVRDASTEVRLDGHVVELGDDRVRFAATGSVSRRQLGLRWGALEDFGVLIADTVTIIVAAEFVR
jgi:polyisoprenoid-binding protein YceI